MKNSVSIRIEIQDEAVLHATLETMKVEMKGVVTDRGRAEISREGNILCMQIFGRDFVALRALTNSTMRLLKASMEIAEQISFSS
ncbi:MAG: CTAG/PCC1 family protein [Candidatus Heimdallarchaeota archaeon]|nr:CTAG/PCC1 family protein [Candidatus Heimdallarchaeota archaeon]